MLLLINLSLRLLFAVFYQCFYLLTALDLSHFIYMSVKHFVNCFSLNCFFKYSVTCYLYIIFITCFCHTICLGNVNDVNPPYIFHLIFIHPNIHQWSVCGVTQSSGSSWFIATLRGMRHMQIFLSVTWEGLWWRRQTGTPLPFFRGGLLTAAMQSKHTQTTALLGQWHTDG